MPTQALERLEPAQTACGVTVCAGRQRLVINRDDLVVGVPLLGEPRRRGPRAAGPVGGEVDRIPVRAGRGGRDARGGGDAGVAGGRTVGGLPRVAAGDAVLDRGGAALDEARRTDGEAVRSGADVGEPSPVDVQRVRRGAEGGVVDLPQIRGEGEPGRDGGHRVAAVVDKHRDDDDVGADRAGRRRESRRRGAPHRRRQPGDHSSHSSERVNRWLAGRALPKLTNAIPLAVPWSQTNSSKSSYGTSIADWVLKLSRSSGFEPMVGPVVPAAAAVVMSTPVMAVAAPRWSMFSPVTVEKPVPAARTVCR